MPAFNWNRSLGVFTKVCSRCKKEYHGADAQADSEIILHKFFHHGPCSDGFQSHCRICQHTTQRQRNGIIGDYNIEEIFAAQSGTCAICREPIKLYQGRGGGAQLDHDHTTGLVRGLLCLDCNQGLGKFKESYEVLIRAAEYLRKGSDETLMRPS